MHSITVTMFLVSLLGGGNGPKDDPTAGEVRLLFDTIESLQQPVDDFRCEFEGTIRYNRMAGKLHKVQLGDDGLYESYNGVFIWKRGGDIYMDAFRRRAPENMVWRETLVVRMSERKAEQYLRSNDATLGGEQIGDPGPIFQGMRAFPVFFFSIAYLEHVAPALRMHHWFEDGRIDGQPLRIVNVAFSKDRKDLCERYWIDLRRNGNVRRREYFNTHRRDPDGNPVRTSQSNIKLAPFKVGGNDIWMPVSGEDERYSILDPDKGKIVTPQDDPWYREEMHVVDGTMELNRHPGSEVFTMKYRPGTPVSDNLRKLQYEYGQQTIRARPTKAEAEKMLKEQVALAEKQKSELVVASTSEGLAWSTWLAWGFGALVIVSSVLLWIQRRGH